MTDQIMIWMIIAGVVAINVGMLILVVLLLPKRAKIKEPASGLLELVGVPERARAASSQTGTLTGVLHGQGLPARPVSIHLMIPVAKMPSPGEKIPVTYCRLDPDQIRVEWDRIETGQARAQSMAQQRADALNQQGRARPQWEVVKESRGTLEEQLASLDPEERRAMESMLREMSAMTEPGGDDGPSW